MWFTILPALTLTPHKVYVDHPPFEVSVEGLRELEVETTLLAGRVVYSRTKSNSRIF